MAAGSPSSLEEDWLRIQDPKAWGKTHIPKSALDVWYNWGYEEGNKANGKIRRYDGGRDERVFRDSWSFKQGYVDGWGDRE